MTPKPPLQSLGHVTANALLLLLCWTTFGLASSHAQETKLAWQFKQGDQFQVETTKLSERTSTLDSRITKMLTDVVLEFDWTVDAVGADGNATITQELTGFSINIGDPAVPIQAIEYSSDIAPAELTSAMRKLQRKAKPLIGLKCVLEMTSNGQITSIRLDAESQKKLAKLTKAPNLQALFSKESLEKITNDLSLTAIPTDADSAGWSKTETRASDLGEISIDHKFSTGPSETIKGRKLIKVDVVSNLTPPADDTTVKEPTAKNEISQTLTSLTGNGSLVFDIDGGYFSSSQFKTIMKSERKYREKLILISVENETRIKIEKK